MDPHSHSHSHSLHHLHHQQQQQQQQQQQPSSNPPHISTTPPTIPSIDSIEQSLLTSFRTAATSVTQLYRESLKQNRQSFATGYAQCLQDIWQYVSTRSPTLLTMNVNVNVNVNVNLDGSQNTQQSNQQVIPVDELVAFLRSKQDQIASSFVVENELSSSSSSSNSQTANTNNHNRGNNRHQQPSSSEQQQQSQQSQTQTTTQTIPRQPSALSPSLSASSIALTSQDQPQIQQQDHKQQPQLPPSTSHQSLPTTSSFQFQQHTDPIHISPLKRRQPPSASNVDSVEFLGRTFQLSYPYYQNQQQQHPQQQHINSTEHEQHMMDMSEIMEPPLKKSRYLNGEDEDEVL